MIGFAAITPLAQTALFAAGSGETLAGLCGQVFDRITARTPLADIYGDVWERLQALISGLNGRVDRDGPLSVALFVLRQFADGKHVGGASDAEVSRECHVALAALAAELLLTAPTLPSDEEVIAAFRRFGFGEVRNPDIVGLLTCLEKMRMEGGVPAQTVLSEDVRVLTANRIARSLGLENATLLENIVPKILNWKPARPVRGGGRDPLRERLGFAKATGAQIPLPPNGEKAGETVMLCPFFLARGASSPEYLVTGRSTVVVVQGRLQDVHGNGYEADASYEQDAGGMYELHSVGNNSAIVYLIYRGEIVFTGMDNHGGAALMERHEIGAADIAAVLEKGFEGKSREELIRYILGNLMTLDPPHGKGFIRRLLT